ncbi:MAG TPA: polysaccharide biosynthesis/export family protein [Bryobacteraceae bacterium]|nr:polysaccharide biosynthesis/export family protein [Bryobacteraceae bacterium]
MAICLAGPGVAAVQEAKSSYLIGADDQLSIHVAELEELPDKPVLVDTNGSIYLPLVGAIHVAGLTVEQLREALIEKLKKYVKDPAVSVSVAEFRSQPVSVLGSVGSPGVLQLRGNKNLFEVLSMAGGVRPDAGNSIRITRRLDNGRIPLAGAVDDPTGKFSIAEVQIKDIMEARKPEENIEVKSNDVISVPRGEMVYVVGEVRSSGGYPLTDRKTISILEALSMAGGLAPTASSSNAKVLRTIAGKAERTEITVNLGSIMKGKSKDMALQANDILVVSGSSAKKVAAIALPAIVTSGVYAGVH